MVVPWVAAAAVVVTDPPRMVVRKAEAEEVAINEEDVVVEAVEVVAAEVEGKFCVFVHYFERYSASHKTLCVN